MMPVWAIALAAWIPLAVVAGLLYGARVRRGRRSWDREP